MRTTNAKTVAEKLIQYFSRVGIPNEIVSDQGPNFMSKLLAQLYDHLGVTKIKTSVYHPEANGLLERINGTLKGMLKKFVRDRVQIWDEYLPYLLFAYREALFDVHANCSFLSAVVYFKENYWFVLQNIMVNSANKHTAI